MPRSIARSILWAFWAVGSFFSLPASGFLLAAAAGPSFARRRRSAPAPFGAAPPSTPRRRAEAREGAEEGAPNAAAAASSGAAAQKWDVDRYQNSHSFVWKYGSSLLDLIDADALVSLASQDSRREIRALDVGCGTGQLTQQLRDRLAAAVSAGSSGAGVRGVRVLGMDLDPSMVESARSSFPSIEFFEGDARSFRLDGPVHLILSNAALHWVPPPDAGRAAESIGLALAPGGQLVAEFGGRGNVRAIVAALRRVFPPPPSEPAPEVWYYPSVAEFSSVLERHGIEVTSASLYDRPTPLEEGDGAMRNWILMFGSKFWEHLSLGDGELESRIDEAVELLRPGLYDPDAGQWTADYRRLRVVGRKLPG